MPIDFLGNTEEYHQALVAALAEHDSHLITVMTGSRGTDETAFELLCTKCDDVVFSRPGSGPQSEAPPPMTKRPDDTTERVARIVEELEFLRGQDADFDAAYFNAARVVLANWLRDYEQGEELTST